MNSSEPIGVLHGVPARNRIWRCFYTERQQESTAANSLSFLGEVLAPTCQYYQTYSGYNAQRLKTEPLFPRYVLACVPDEAIGLTKRLRGIQYVVRFGGEPARVPEYVIEELRLMIQDGVVDLTRPLVPGERVTILSGPLTGQQGIFQFEAKDRCEVLMAMLGREKRMPFPRLNVQPVYQ